MLYDTTNWVFGSTLIDGSGNRLIPGKMKFVWIDTDTGKAEVYQVSDSGLVLGDDGKPAKACVNLQLPLTVVPEGVTYDAGTTRRTAEGGS
jgi:hypothetical protein